MYYTYSSAGQYVYPPNYQSNECYLSVLWVIYGWINSLNYQYSRCGQYVSYCSYSQAQMGGFNRQITFKTDGLHLFSGRASHYDPFQIMLNTNVALYAMLRINYSSTACRYLKTREKYMLFICKCSYK